MPHSAGDAVPSGDLGNGHASPPRQTWRQPFCLRRPAVPAQGCVRHLLGKEEFPSRLAAVDGQARLPRRARDVRRLRAPHHRRHRAQQE